MTIETTTEETNTYDPGQVLDFASATNPHGAYAELRERCPVGRSGADGFTLLYLSRYEDVSWALRHPEYFTSEGDPMAISEQPLIPLQFDPPKHTKYRRLLSAPFFPVEIRKMEPRLRELIRARVDAIAPEGHCTFHEEFATPLPTGFFLALMGLSLDDLPVFLRWRDETVRPDVAPDDFDAAAEIRSRVAKEITNYLRAAIDSRRTAPDEGFLSTLLEAKIDGELLTEVELLGISHLLMLAGLDTVTATLDCFFANFARNPELRHTLTADESLVPAAVEELLRYETPVQMVVRSVKTPIKVGGVALETGEDVAVVIGAANTDEAEFGNVDIDLNRKPNRHVAFGTGNHFCLGAHLARAELRIAIEEFHRQIPDYRLADDCDPQFSPGIRQADRLELVWDV